MDAGLSSSSTQPSVHNPQRSVRPLLPTDNVLLVVSVCMSGQVNSVARISFGPFVRSLNFCDGLIDLLATSGLRSRYTVVFRIEWKYWWLLHLKSLWWGIARCFVAAVRNCSRNLNCTLTLQPLLPRVWKIRDVLWKEKSSWKRPEKGKKVCTNFGLLIKLSNSTIADSDLFPVALHARVKEGRITCSQNCELWAEHFLWTGTSPIYFLVFELTVGQHPWRYPASSGLVASAGTISRQTLSCLEDLNVPPRQDFVA